MKNNTTQPIVLRGTTIQYKIADNGMLLVRIVNLDPMIGVEQLQIEKNFVAIAAKYLVDEGFVKVGVDGTLNI